MKAHPLCIVAAVMTVTACSSNGGKSADGTVGNPDVLDTGVWDLMVDSEQMMDATPGGDVPDASPDCSKRWTIHHRDPQAVSVEIANGALVVASTTMEYSLTSVFQTGLSGDFTVEFSFDQLEASPGVTVGAFIRHAGGASSASTHVRTRETTRLGSFVDFIDGPGNESNEVEISPTGSGTFSLSRSGNFITATAVADGTTVTTTGSDVPGSRDFEIGIGVSSNLGYTGPRSVALHITEFAVSQGGGTVKSDSFDCDTLIP